MALTKPMLNGNKTWFTGTLLATLAGGPEAWNAILGDNLGSISETPIWLLFVVLAAAILSLNHAVKKNGKPATP